MALMSSGEFARTSGLTRKALRLYDELGLLTPTRVDPQSGYRFYAPAQLEQARLVAWLRRLGMPLAEIRSIERTVVCRGGGRSLALTGIGSRLETGSPGESSRPSSSGTCLGRTLIWHLLLRKSSPCDTRCGPTSGSRARTTRTPPTPAADCLPIADGMGGHEACEAASAAVIAALRPLDTQVPSGGELLNALGHAVQRAEGTLREMVAATRRCGGWGRRSPRCCDRDPGSGSRTSATPGRISSAAARSSRSPGTTRWCSRCWTRARSRADEASSHPQRFPLLQALDGEHDYSGPTCSSTTRWPGTDTCCRRTGCMRACRPRRSAPGPVGGRLSGRGGRGADQAGDGERRAGQRDVHRGGHRAGG